MWLLLVAATLLAVSLAFLLNKPDPPPIYGVYRRPGKFFYLKYWLFRILLFFRKKISVSTGENLLDGKLAQDLDRAQPLSASPKAFDAVFFMGITQNGFYVVIGSERRKQNVVNGLFYLVVPELGLLCSNKVPDTVLFNAQSDTFGAEGILLEPVEPMRKWKLSYKGEMWLYDNATKRFVVDFNGMWTSSLPVFNFESDLDHRSLATTIATEPWSRDYFNMLKKAHQSHYEQMGQMDASVVVGNCSYKLTNMPAFRDHSYGSERDWDLMHRYVFHMMFLEDGTKATVGVICQPVTGSMLQVGYVYLPKGEVHPIEWCDFKLYQHGESGKPPTDYAFQFKAGERVYTVQVSVEHQSVHYVGWRWEARMVERFVSYSVDGVRGRGVSEWHYHNSSGRPPSACARDPAWFSEAVEKYYSNKGIY